MASTAAQPATLPSPKRKRSIVALPSRTRVRPSNYRTSEVSPNQRSIVRRENDGNEDVRQSFQDLEIAPTPHTSRGVAGPQKVYADSGDDDDRMGFVTPPSPNAATEDWSYQKTTAEKHSLPGGFHNQDGEDAQEEEGIVATPPYSPSHSASEPKALATNARAASETQTSVMTGGCSTPVPHPDEVPLPASPSPSPHKARRKQVTSSSDLFWSFSEITGYLPSSAKTDPFDDGTGINGVGFARTRAEAARRAKKRRDAVAEWKKREQREDRARRAREKDEKARRVAARTRGVVEDSETEELGIEVKAVGREVKKKVRFAPRSASNVKKKGERT